MHMRIARTVLFALAVLIIISPIAAKDPPEPSDVVYIIPIQGEIDPSRTVFIRRSIERARNDGAGILIFEIDTFGGRVDSALQIATLIGSVNDAATLAYVPAQAEGTGVSWSAGALISFSCNFIYMEYGTSMGAAAPVYQTQGGMEMAPEKTVSAVRAQMAALAEKNGYPKAVALAMVDQDTELIEVEVGEDLYAVLADEVEEYQEKAEKDGKEFDQGKTISAVGKLLTLTAGEMERYGVSSGTVNVKSEFYELLGVSDARIVRLEESVPDKVVAILTSAAVTGILVLIGLVAMYMEVTSPGFGLPGTAAIICFAVVFLGSALLGTVGSVELLLFMAGVILLVVEIFLIPGFGVTGISGIIFMGIALVLSRQDFIFPKFDWQWEILKRNLLVVGSSLIGSLAVFGILMRFLPKASLFKRLVLETSISGTASVADIEEPGPAAPAGKIGPVGKTGVVVTSLRPVGKAEIDGEVVEVQAGGDFIEQGKQIEVIEVHGSRMIVTEVGEKP